MHSWFKGAAIFEKVLENGLQKRVKEWYLVDALSFTEAEARLIEEVKPFISGEFTVSDIKRGRYSEVFFGEGEFFWEAKIEFTTLDEKSGLEKRTKTKALVQSSSDIKEAIEFFEEGMKGTLADYRIAGFNMTDIMDVFPFGLTTQSGEKVEEHTERIKSRREAENDSESDDSPDDDSEE